MWDTKTLHNRFDPDGGVDELASGACTRSVAVPVVVDLLLVLCSFSFRPTPFRDFANFTIISSFLLLKQSYTGRTIYIISL